MALPVHKDKSGNQWSTQPGNLVFKLNASPVLWEEFIGWRRPCLRRLTALLPPIRRHLRNTALNIVDFVLSFGVKCIWVMCTSQQCRKNQGRTLCVFLSVLLPWDSLLLKQELTDLARLAKESIASASLCSHYSWLFHGRWESNCGRSCLCSDRLTHLPHHLSSSSFTLIMMADHHCMALGAIGCSDAHIHCYNIQVRVLIVYLPTLILFFIEVDIQNPLPNCGAAVHNATSTLPDPPLWCHAHRSPKPITASAYLTFPAGHHMMLFCQLDDKTGSPVVSPTLGALCIYRVKQSILWGQCRATKVLTLPGNENDLSLDQLSHNR